MDSTSLAEASCLSSPKWRESSDDPDSLRICSHSSNDKEDIKVNDLLDSESKNSEIDSHFRCKSVPSVENESHLKDGTHNVEVISDLSKSESKNPEKNLKELQREHEDEELRATRYKGLKSLLEKSQFYTQVALNKLNSISLNRNRKGKRKHDFLYSENSDQIKNFASKKRKLSKGKTLLENTNMNVSNRNDAVEEPEKVKLTSLGIEVPACQPSLLIGAALRDYQIEGLNWMKKLFIGGLNGILADEMGLGKTIQTIALICHLYEEGVGGPFMIVAPLSTLPNWAMEFERFAPDVPVVTYQGSAAERPKLLQRVNKLYDVLGYKSLPVVLMAYHTVYADEKHLNKLFWKYIIVDEGHRLKNHNSRLHKSLSSMRSVNKVLLTGTPLQNDLTELWSLLNFLVPEIFTSLQSFNSWFEVGNLEESMSSILEQEQRDHVLSLLHQILGPFMLRRVKASVNLNLPPKKEVYVYCPLTDTQYQLYKQTLDHSIIYKKFKEEPLIIPDNEDGSKAKRGARKLEYQEPRPDGCIVIDGDTYRLNIKLQNPMMMLRKIANHPHLVECPTEPGSNWMRVDERTISSSGKASVLDTLLTKLKAGGHKVVLFSTFKLMLDIIEECLNMRGHSFVRLDGDHDMESRKENIKKFNTDPSMFVFLVSTRAGGLGLNLTAADTVIIYDSDWNPQMDLQAQDRCHRIGQTRPVIVYRLVSIGTIDERIITLGHAKRKLEKAVIQAGNFGEGSGGAKPKAIDLSDLQRLLEEKTHSGEIRCEELLSEQQWDQLLDRSFT